MNPFKKKKKPAEEVPATQEKEGRPSRNFCLTPLISSLVPAIIGIILLFIYRKTFFTPVALDGLILLIFPCAGIPLSIIKIIESGNKNEGSRVNKLIPGAIVISAVSASVCCYFLVSIMKKKTANGATGWIGTVVLLFIFVVLVIVDKILANTSEEDEGAACLAASARSYIVASRIALILTAVCEAVKLLGFYDLQNIVNVMLCVIFFYCLLFLIVSYAVRAIKRELLSHPEISVPVPFFGHSDLSLSGYLEKNTGISMRSLFSIGLIRRIFPIAFCAGLLLLWLSTGLVEIAPYEEGAVYRFGVLREGFLKPGLNLVLPYPIDKVERYETGTVKSVTIGYIGSTDADVVWTEAHSGEEFKLLLGDGNQLVSVNLRIEYKINDLSSYLKFSNSPEKLLEASAYELITSEIVSTDLETLLSVDRGEFSEEFHELLSEKLTSLGSSPIGTSTGIEVVSVALESIHPPVAVAGKYQELISAGISAEKALLDAKGYASRTKAEAEASRDSLISSALAEKYTKIAEAEGAVAEFMASVEADSLYSTTYRNMKYLNALSAAYGGSKLVIVGDGIDTSRIWLGYPKAN